LPLAISVAAQNGIAQVFCNPSEHERRSLLMAVFPIVRAHLSHRFSSVRMAVGARHPPAMTLAVLMRPFAAKRKPSE
jgi:hypothetical protein